MADLKLYLLGSPALTVDGQAVEIQRRKVLALLSYLAVNGQPQRRDTLATLFWPEAGQSQARAALGRHLSEIRNLIGVECVLADRETTALAGEIWVDAQQFQQLTAAFGGKEPARSELLDQAVALYRGDFMTGFTLPDCPAFDEWQFFQSEGLRQQFATALAQLVTRDFEQGDYAAALPYARRLLALDTLDEAAQRQVMELYALTGQQSAAIRQYELCVQMLAAEFGASPAVETKALYEQIRRGELSRKDQVQGSRGDHDVPPLLPRPPAPLHNLPAQLTPFIGREVELAELAALLSGAEGRLVTIVGPGGMGKTRLALAAAEAQLAATRFAHGIFFISLAPLNDVAHIIPAIAEAIGYRFEAEGQAGHSTRTQLLNYLRGRQLLLVLDNFENLLDGVALVSDILQAAPEVQILATSRERLHLHGEQLFPIQGLGFPDWETPADAATYTAVQLFMQSARRIQPHFELTAADSTHLTRICRLTEGMPLAIELAAGWVDLLSLTEIMAEIQRSLDFLATEVRNVPERQRSMRAVFDHSWARLNEAEQQTFARFAVFRGGFTRQAAQAVTGASLHLLSRLAAKSLLQYDRTPDRYQLHELLRQYAAEKLEITAQTETVRAAHAAYFADFLQQQEADLKSQGQRRAKVAIAADFENVRQAWLWAVERRDHATLDRAIEGLYWFLYHDLQRYHAGQALFQSGREMLAPSENEAPHSLWGKLLARVLPYGPGNFEQPVQAKLWLEQARSLAEAQGDAAEQAFCRWLLGHIRLDSGNLALATSDLEQSLCYYRQVADRFYMARVLHILGGVYAQQKKYQQATDCLQQSLRLHRELGISEFPVATQLGLHLAASGGVEAGEALLRRAYQSSQAAGNPSDMAGALTYLSRVLSKKGDFAGAQRAALEALAITQEHNLEYRQLQARMDVGMRAYERGDFTPAFAHLSEVQDRITIFRDQVRIEVTLALTVDQLGQDDLTRSYLVSRLRGPINLALYSLPLAVLLFKRAGNFEQAATLLALFSLHDQLSYLARLDATRSLFQPLKAALTAALPPDRFTAAWARGEALDLATTLVELAEESDGLSM